MTNVFIGYPSVKAKVLFSKLDLGEGEDCAPLGLSIL